MSERQSPRLGGETPTGYTCTREVGARFGDKLCGQPAVMHIAWDETYENSLACVTHAQSALVDYEPYDWHDVGYACANVKVWVSSGTPGDSYCTDDGPHPDLASVGVVELEATR